MNQKLFKQVRRFVSDFTHKPLLEIEPETSLFLDTNLTLETAPGFFECFGEEFSVDVRGVDLLPYFQPTNFGTGGEGAVGLWVFWFFTKERHQFRGVKPLLVKDLVEMAKTKRWCSQ